jgi:Tfp pilus assembly protein FimT
MVTTRILAHGAGGTRQGGRFRRGRIGALTKIGNRHRQRGFTWVESIATLAVSAALLGAAAPNLSTFVQNNRIRAATYDFLTTIVAARTEAIKRGEPVILCRTGNPFAGNDELTCNAPEPGGTPSQNDDWSKGFIVYQKPNYSGSGGVGGDYNPATDGEALGVGRPAPGGVTIKSNSAGNRWLAFHTDGTLNESGSAVYAICDNRGVEPGRLVTVPPVGRPYVSMSPPSSCDP